MKPTVYLILFRSVGGKTQLPITALREKLTKAGLKRGHLHQRRRRHRPQPGEPEESHRHSLAAED